QISIKIFRYIVSPPEVVVGVRENLMLLINSHILKMATMLQSSAEYNRGRVAIIERIYDNVVTKYTALEQSNKDSSMSARKSHSKERTMTTPAIVERAQALISNDPGQSLRKLASIVGISESTTRRIAEEDLRYKLYTLKIQQTLSEVARTSRVARLGSHFGLPTTQI
ncbi:hypothetical protein ALC53_13463, partial [Atta colombica]